MKVKYLKRNLKNTRKTLKNLAKDYKVKFRWTQWPKDKIILVSFEKKVTRKYTRVVCENLDEAKVAYGNYKPAMVKYNLERKLVRWLNDED